MKSYTIWLKSGSCIEGDMSIEEAERLKNEYISDSYSTRVREYNDTDGNLLISFCLIYAMSFNEVSVDKDIGFVGGQ